MAQQLLIFKNEKFAEYNAYCEKVKAEERTV